MEKRALLIDFDGTLVDSEVVHYDSWQHVLSPFDIHYTEQAFCLEFAGVPTLQAATVIKKRHNLDVSAQWLCEQKNQQFVLTSEQVKPRLLAGVKVFLNAAKQQFTLVLVTGSTRNEAIPVLAHYGLLDLFSATICKDDVINPKPDPEPYLKALKLLSIKPQEAFALEDSTTGLQSATAAGVQTVVIPHEYSKSQDHSKASYIANDIIEAWEYIQKNTYLETI
ncbi:HAD family hydrolase [Pseudoalteromonas sp. MTN2-4]|uniref:HAD family hydrolase n=1 Tax=Pseudoalteromonas sp. MTN2-4 TaxID=3056555 RepID=UPI0036F3AB01